jgi:hypothetical protein
MGVRCKLVDLVFLAVYSPEPFGYRYLYLDYVHAKNQYLSAFDPRSKTRVHSNDTYRYLYLDYVHAKNHTYLLLIPGPKPESTAMIPSMAVLIIEVCFVIWGENRIICQIFGKKSTPYDRRRFMIWFCLLHRPSTRTQNKHNCNNLISSIMTS